MLFELRNFRVIILTIVNILGPFWAILCIMMTLFYVFGIIGLYFFGGKITTSTDYIVMDSSVPKLYYLCNFNDLANGFLTLFELMVVNNWFVIADLYIGITGT